jgi:hypothetical protein
VSLELQACFAGLWPAELRVEAPQAVGGAKRGGFRGFGKIAAGLLGAAGLIWLSIVLILRMSTGEIRIESAVDNVHIEVLDDGKLVDSLVVQQGESSVKVRSGEYQIRIDAPSDGVEVTPEKVVVTRAGTAIARIEKVTTSPASVARAAEDAGSEEVPDRRAAAELQLALVQAEAELATANRLYGSNHPEVEVLADKVARLRSVSQAIPTEPVFEGRTFAEWVAQMRFEQQAEARQHAAASVMELASTRPDREALEIAIEAGTVLFGKSFGRTNDDWSWKVDYSIRAIASGG